VLSAFRPPGLPGDSWERMAAVLVPNHYGSVWDSPELSMWHWPADPQDSDGDEGRDTTQKINAVAAHKRCGLFVLHRLLTEPASGRIVLEIAG